MVSRTSAEQTPPSDYNYVPQKYFKNTNNENMLKINKNIHPGQVINKLNYPRSVGYNYKNNFKIGAWFDAPIENASDGTAMIQNMPNEDTLLKRIDSIDYKPDYWTGSKDINHNTPTGNTNNIDGDAYNGACKFKREAWIDTAVSIEPEGNYLNPHDNKYLISRHIFPGEKTKWIASKQQINYMNEKLNDRNSGFIRNDSKNYEKQYCNERSSIETHGPGNRDLFLEATFITYSKTLS